MPTETQKNTIKELYPIMNTAEISEITKLRREDINAYARSIGLRHGPEVVRNWSRAEILEFKRIYPFTTNAKLAKRYNRNTRTIQGLALKLKLKKTQNHLSKIQKAERLKRDNACNPYSGGSEHDRLLRSWRAIY